MSYSRQNPNTGRCSACQGLFCYNATTTERKKRANGREYAPCPVPKCVGGADLHIEYCPSFGSLYDEHCQCPGNPELWQPEIVM